MSIVAVGITLDEAERITEQIVGRIDAISENVDAVMSLMREALARNAHQVLGYVSPGAYISDRFGDALSGLSAALRREFVHELSEAGMSNRAIAPVFGMSEGTVRNDLKAGAQRYAPGSAAAPLPGVPDETPATHATPDQTVTLANIPATFEHDGMTVTTAGEVIEPTVTEHTITEKVKTVTGLDGKTYTRPEPKPKPVLEGTDLLDYDARQIAERVSNALQTLNAMRTNAHRERVLTKWWPRAIENEEVPPWGLDLFKPEPIRQIAQALTSLANELEGMK